MRKATEGIVISIKAIMIFLLLIAILWACLFVTDYIMYKNGKHTIFSITSVKQVEDKYVTYEHGLGYHLYIDGFGNMEMYLLNSKIK